MYFRQETSNLASPMYLDLNLMVSGFKNRGRCNFTSCWPKRVNTKKNYLKKLDPICALHAKFQLNQSTGGWVMDGFTYKSKLCCPPFCINWIYIYSVQVLGWPCLLCNECNDNLKLHLYLLSWHSCHTSHQSRESEANNGKMSDSINRC